jgi:hypothetical protein
MIHVIGISKVITINVKTSFSQQFNLEQSRVLVVFFKHRVVCQGQFLVTSKSAYAGEEIETEK